METGVPDIWSISWQEAIQREHEYRKKVKIQEVVDNSEPPTAAQQESPSKADVVVEGIDSLDNLQPDDVQTSSKKLKSEVPLQQNYVMQRPPMNHWSSSPSLENHSQQNIRPFWDKRSIPGEKLCQQTAMLHQYWCHFCLVNCTSELNFILHLHGQKHRLTLQEFKSKKSTLLEKGVTWCHECNVPCMGLYSLTQHRQGKKHQARMTMLAKYKASGGSSAFATSDTWPL